MMWLAVLIVMVSGPFSPRAGYRFQQSHATTNSESVENSHSAPNSPGADGDPVAMKEAEGFSLFS